MSASRREILSNATCSTIFLLAAPHAVAAGGLDREWAPFEIGDGGLIVWADVNGVRSRAILDTGASHTLIDARFARKAGVRAAEADLAVNGWTNDASARLAAPTAVRIGPYSAQVAPLLMRFGDAGPPQPILLGRNLFAGRILEIDFVAARLRIRSKAKFAVDQGYYHLSHPTSEPLAAPKRGTAPNLIAMSVEGHRVDARLDLGSARALHLSRPFVDRCSLLTDHKVSAALSGDVGGYRAAPVFTCSALEIGNVTLRDIPTEVFEAPTERAIVGLELISRFRVLLDVQQEDVWARPVPDRLAQPFVKDRTGLAVRSRGQAGEVVFVAPGSPAEEAGFREGDLVERVDRKPWSAQSKAWRSGPAGVAHTLELANGSTRVLVLADYF